MKLYSPINIQRLELPNRIVMSPMCMYAAVGGLAQDFHHIHYLTRAVGGVGLVMVEATGVEPAGRITTKCLGLWNDEQQSALQNIVSAIHRQSDAKVGIQLAHAGRKASTWEGRQIRPEDGGWQPKAPSDIPYQDGEIAPHPLSVGEIASLVEAFAQAAGRAKDAGFDVVEIHAAHGYLIHQFLSPLSNRREDEYGGSFENRCRLLEEIIAAIKKTVGQNFPLWVRISADEYAEGGWSIGDSIVLAKKLRKLGVDLVDVSSGGNISGARINVFNGYQVPFAEAIKKETGILTGCVGLITTHQQAKEILQQDRADLIFLGRELLRNPYFPLQGVPSLEDIPYSYRRGFPDKS